MRFEHAFLMCRPVGLDLASRDERTPLVRHQLSVLKIPLVFVYFPGERTVSLIQEREC